MHLKEKKKKKFKYTKKQFPSSFDNMFRFNNSVHSYPTRISGNFHLVNPKLSIAHKSVRHCGPDIWNNLPDNIKSCSTLYFLKATLKRNIIQSLYTSLNSQSINAPVWNHYKFALLFFINCHLLHLHLQSHCIHLITYQESYVA